MKFSPTLPLIIIFISFHVTKAVNGTSHVFNSTCQFANASSATIIITSVSSESATVLCDLFNASNQVIYQQYWLNQTFVAGVPSAFVCVWSNTILTPGNYAITIGVFSPDWTTNYQWINSAGTFTVSLPVTPTFVITGSVSSTTVPLGGTVVLTATVTSSSGPVNVLIDLEIYDGSGNQNFQWYKDNQQLAAGKSQTWTAKWTVPTTNIVVGTIMNFDIGLFKPNWVDQYVWQNNVASFTIVSTKNPTTTTPGTVGVVTHTVTTVNGQMCDVYSWPDSKGLLRTVALKQQGNGNTGNGGYAIQMTYRVASTGSLVAVNWDTSRPNGDGGFGYFVSHERWRTFSDQTQDTIAEKVFGQDDSPLGLGFSVIGGVLTSTMASSAAHRFTLSYPHYGTIVPGAIDANGDDMPPLSLNQADYKEFWMKINLTWVFQAGTDYPRIDHSIDLSNIARADIVNFDVRGPYGVMVFDNGTNGVVTNLQWGDRYHFIATQTPVTRASTWIWNVANQGARYHALIAGQYEMGLFEPKLYSNSGFADDYSNARGTTSVNYNPASDGCTGQLLPCNFPYQSLQYELPPSGVTNSKKIAWGSTSYYGTSLTMTYDTPTTSQTFVGWPTDEIFRYSICIVLGITIPNGLTKTVAASTTTFNCATQNYA